jgi:hypothetical protein
MLSYSNLGGGGGSWNDVLWISTYTGGDVKASNALIMGKTSEFIGFARQNYDATSWGPVRTILHSGNYTSYAAAASHNHSTLNSGTWTRSQTSHGYIDFGPANTGAAHIYTDRAQFYYNKGATMVGDLTLNGPSYGAREIITTSNCNLILKPSGKYSLGLGYDGTISLLVDHPASGKFFVMDAMGTGSQGGEPTLRPSHTGGWGYIGADSYYKFYRGYCSSWVNSSSLEFKENLRPFDCDEAYDLIKNMPVYAYRHKDKEDIQLGVLVEDSPLEVLNVDSYGADQKSIDVYSFTAMTLAAVQKMQQKIEQLEMELASMKEVA